MLASYPRKAHPLQELPLTCGEPLFHSFLRPFGQRAQLPNVLTAPAAAGGFIQHDQGSMCDLLLDARLLILKVMDRLIPKQR
jgi:hypothetical protein